MTKAFNQLMSYNEIQEAYKTNSFPNAFCLLWNKERNVELVSTEEPKAIFSEDRKGVAVNGSTEL